MEKEKGGKEKKGKRSLGVSSSQSLIGGKRVSLLKDNLQINHCIFAPLSSLQLSRKKGKQRDKFLPALSSCPALSFSIWPSVEMALPRFHCEE